MYGDSRKGATASPTVNNTASSTLKPRIKTDVKRKALHVVISSFIPPIKPIKRGTMTRTHGFIAVKDPPIKDPPAASQMLLEDSHCCMIGDNSCMQSLLDAQQGRSVP
jgi:hypothetical protein